MWGKGCWFACLPFIRDESAQGMRWRRTLSVGGCWACRCWNGTWGGNWMKPEPLILSGFCKARQPAEPSWHNPAYSPSGHHDGKFGELFGINSAWFSHNSRWSGCLPSCTLCLPSCTLSTQSCTSIHMSQQMRRYFKNVRPSLLGFGSGIWNILDIR